ncbi:MAG: type II secretion system minor pseudopilin GspI [Burkholderiaceae bacterium]|jgi:general secretion pathway protein I|nr:type II secretion system minor pseudopilin GspI [Burkholderiaceae bacterium]
MTMTRRRANPGFTLIEVMVALAITAIALVAGFKATDSLTNDADRQAAVLLGHICAENTLIALRLARRLPGVGDTDNVCVQGGRRFTVTQSVLPTPNPYFRRVQATVRQNGWVVVRLSTLMGQR